MSLLAMGCPLDVWEIRVLPPLFSSCPPPCCPPGCPRWSRFDVQARVFEPSFPTPKVLAVVVADALTSFYIDFDVSTSGETTKCQDMFRFTARYKARGAWV